MLSVVIHVNLENIQILPVVTKGIKMDLLSVECYDSVYTMENKGQYTNIFAKQV